MSKLLLDDFFGVHGRLSRRTFIFRILILAMFCAAFGMLGQELVGEYGSTIFSALFLSSLISLGAKRLHDSGQNALSLLWFVVPVFGPLWLLFQFLKRGVDGDNRYGHDPLKRGGYLKVDISQ
jgi:uncharacterized membrane protein YhaH (DUF805 family)